jgi:alpha-acetolactate decarboxylase
VELAEVVKRPHAYGVGALERLEGEVTIIDGTVLVCRSEGGRPQLDKSRTTPTDEAALLVVAHVDRWQEVPVTKALSGEALEDFIADAGKKEGRITAASAAPRRP